MAATIIYLLTITICWLAVSVSQYFNS